MDLQLGRLFDMLDGYGSSIRHWSSWSRTTVSYWEREAFSRTAAGSIPSWWKRR